MSPAAPGSLTYDCLIVGSGINGLVCATRLARAGHRVCVIERNDRLGGCIRTDALTLPGFVHDTLSGFHPLFVTSPGYAEFGDELRAHGLEYAPCDAPTGVVLDDGSSLVMTTDHADNVARFNAAAAGDGDAYHHAIEAVGRDAALTFGLLGGRPWSWATLRLALGELRRRGPGGLATYVGEATGDARSWLTRDFRSDAVRALFAPWVLHTGLGPDSALSGAMGKVIAFTLEQAGNPIVKGGADRLVQAFRQLIEAHGGDICVGTEADRIVVENGAARAVTTTDGRTFTARRAIACSVTPRQLYHHLLREAAVPEAVLRDAAAFRHGRADMQIHLALDAPPDWSDPDLKRVAMIHLTPGLDGVSRAVTEADTGLLPARGTIVVGQPSAIDPGRAPDGKAVLWIQLQELPPVIRGDAAGEIAAPPDGRWTAAVAERYADRIIARIAEHLPALPASILARKVLSPADLEQINCNLVGGDPYGGACTLDQFMLWRPLRSTRNHATPFRGLLHIGASTHPGPGLGGVSGFLAADLVR